jgi:hypothetical protein
VVRPWDAGTPEDPEDPFAAAAEGDWIDEPPPESDAGVPTDAASLLEADAAGLVDAAADAGSDAPPPTSAGPADAAAADTGGNP